MFARGHLCNHLIINSIPIFVNLILTRTPRSLHRDAHTPALRDDLTQGKGFSPFSGPYFFAHLTYILTSRF